MKKVGVVVARFQTSDLHNGHKLLLTKVSGMVDQMIIFLGVTHKSRKNPLDFETRKLMVESLLGEQNDMVKILPLRDQKHDSIWVDILDTSIKNIIDDSDDVKLYGSRDSFVPIYHENKGIFETVLIEPTSDTDGLSATIIREEISITPINSSDFRKGMIYNQYSLYPTVYSTVDIIVTRTLKGSNSREILLGQKEIDKPKNLWVFPGGFVDKGDGTGKNAAIRELREETHISTSPDNLEFVEQVEIDDYRTRGTENSIMTSVYTVDLSGWHDNSEASAGDDLIDIKWVLESDVEKYLSDIHTNVWKAFKSKSKKTNI